MEDRGVGEALAGLLAVDVSACDRAGLTGVVKLAQRVRGWVDAVDVAIARRSRELAAEGRSESAAEVLTGHGRRSTRDTKAVSDRSEVCEQMPGFEAALAAGDVSSSHVDAIAQAAKGLDDAGRERLGGLADDLLSFARFEPVAVFERRCRLLGKRLAGDEGESELDRQKALVSVRRWVDKPSGMHHTHLALDPERDAKLWSAIDAQLAALKQTDGNSATPIDRLLADAVVTAVSGQRSGDRRVPEICVHIDWLTLRDGLHENSVCEIADGIPLPPATVRRMACEAAIVPIVLNGAGEVLDCGREQRVANRAQRRALRAMYRTCAYPGCDVTFDRCDIHHVIEWLHHGRTDLDNLLPLCGRHHHLVHEGRWRLQLDQHRVITIHRPDGTQHFHGNTTNRTMADRNRVAVGGRR
ncbi:MAG TPA: DUF222 domain-containing protein [Ilumatobacteraceae bacterium]|nr:DUF222 domain-containing protein [Ilumatobacteraceae bacterium]